MATNTTKLGLTKPDGDEAYDIAIFNTNADAIDASIERTFISATEPTTWQAKDRWIEVKNSQILES